MSFKEDLEDALLTGSSERRKEAVSCLFAECVPEKEGPAAEREARMKRIAGLRDLFGESSRLVPFRDGCRAKVSFSTLGMRILRMDDSGKDSGHIPWSVVEKEVGKLLAENRWEVRKRGSVGNTPDSAEIDYSQSQPTSQPPRGAEAEIPATKDMSALVEFLEAVARDNERVVMPEHAPESEPDLKAECAKQPDGGSQKPDDGSHKTDDSSQKDADKTQGRHSGKSSGSHSGKDKKSPENDGQTSLFDYLKEI